MNHAIIGQGMCKRLFALALVSAAALAQPANAQATWVTVKSGGSAAIAQTQLQAAATATQPVTLAVVLKLNNQATLDSLVAAQNTPGNSSYHQWLTSAQTTANFSPTVAQAQAVADYLTQNGFSNVQIAPNRLLVTATGTVALVQRAFNTSIGVYSRNGASGLAPMSAVQVPASLSQVDSVLGLDTLNKAQTFSVPLPGQTATASSCVTAGQTPPCTSPGNTSGYYPDEFATVYNRPNSQTGRNTAAAIITWGNMTNPVSDLQQFESLQGISPVPTSTGYFPPGTSTTDDSQQSEWAMDAQSIVGISGGVNQLIFYADTTGGSMAGLASAIGQAVSDNSARVINMSWGGCETALGTPFDSLFEAGASQGQTFSAATGDTGSVAYGCYNTSVQYPASSSYVIAIGGTTLTTGAGLAYSSETTWNDFSGATGGGISTVELKPVWQSSLADGYTYRELPDLAFDASPYTGEWVWLTTLNSNDPNITYTGWAQWGGTSLASPLFVGAWAVGHANVRCQYGGLCAAADLCQCQSAIRGSGAARRDHRQQRLLLRLRLLSGWAWL